MAPGADGGGARVHRDATVNAGLLHYVEAGAGPLVVVLHGLPEFWYSWRRQIPALARAGFRVLAPEPPRLQPLREAQRARGVPGAGRRPATSRR